MTASDIHRTIDAVWRIESPRLIAGLTRIVRDVGLAEDLAQDALVAALEQWPESGVPDNPGAWLMATAKHRAMDHFRRNTRLERKHEELGRELGAKEMAVPDLIQLSTITLATTCCACSSSPVIPCSRLKLRLRLPYACSEA